MRFTAALTHAIDVVRGTKQKQRQATTKQSWGSALSHGAEKISKLIYIAANKDSAFNWQHTNVFALGLDNLITRTQIVRTFFSA